ncbi:MAG: zinc ribbon domain-containing protein [Lachnospiraceae bacterium]|nr:zinc ribbon domain-containing protein [Lachnospiraceae bacterium]
MAFFDDLKKNVSKVSQDAVQKTKSFSQDAIQKTKNMADVAKYRSLINDEEKKITNGYQRIGELYYATHEGELAAGIDVIIGEIDAAKAKIEEYNELIKQAKGEIICTECGAQLKPEQKFCTQCGKAVQ